MWAALTSHARLELIEFLHPLGPCSARELAFHVDRPADGLYHHLKLLEAAGLVAQVGFRKGDRQPEALFDLTADRFLFDADFNTGRNVHLYTKVAAIVMRFTDRLLIQAVSAGGLQIEGPHKSLWSRAETSWLTDDDLARVNTHLNAIAQIMNDGRTKRQGRLFSLSLFMFPLVRSRHADERAPAPRRVSKKSPRTPRAPTITAAPPASQKSKSRGSRAARNPLKSRNTIIKPVTIDPASQARAAGSLGEEHQNALHV
jgi:DNA-binding transcriptional ArsR family regulator